MTAPTKISWADPTTNVDGSPVTANEITAYEVGVRLASGVAGTYPYGVKAPASATSALLSTLTPILPTGVALVAAARADTGAVDASGNPVDSDWSAESQPFTLPVPPPKPNPPTNLSVA